MSHNTIVIRWTGSVPVGDLEDGLGGGLYLLSGCCRYERNDTVQYCGITKRDFPKRLSEHHKAHLITRNLRCWTGTIEYPAKPSRATLEIAETLLIYFAQPPLNERKKLSVPKSTTVVSHWYKRNGEPRINQQGLLADFPDVISWDGEYWREGNLRVYTDE